MKNIYSESDSDEVENVDDEDDEDEFLSSSFFSSSFWSWFEASSCFRSASFASIALRIELPESEAFSAISTKFVGSISLLDASGFWLKNYQLVIYWSPAAQAPPKNRWAKIPVFEIAGHNFYLASDSSSSEEEFSFGIDSGFSKADWLVSDCSVNVSETVLVINDDFESSRTDPPSFLITRI